jgi:D-tagatose-1,6-bisphosphate aldolase subunit GatZ/KbaZ
MSEKLKNILSGHWHEGGGIYSVCSANRFVLEASMLQSLNDNTVLLIESTSNQVDQFGGYTGMKPVDFVNYVKSIAHSMRFPLKKIILGGDHLGPNVWQNEEPRIAMQNAKEQVAAYVNAGYTKIHLDASMHLSGDLKEGEKPLDAKITAERSADLCAIAEHAFQNSGLTEAPLYVIGTDVPIPGGAMDDLENIRITPVEEVAESIEVTKEAFYSRGLNEAWERVVAIVAQPGVEFSDSVVIDYNPTIADELIGMIEGFQPVLFEAHSTDYQTGVSLKRMVKDHFAILKVGPGLTFAMREAIFALAHMEKEWLRLKKHTILSNVIETLGQVSFGNPQYWAKHYRGSHDEVTFALHYSYSDRIRYYWPDPSIQKALGALIKNLNKNPIPLNLLNQYLPAQYDAIRNGQINNSPKSIIHHKICQVLSPYSIATGLSRLQN